MEKLSKNLKCHLFICTNQKEKGECCAPKGGGLLRDKMKAWLKQNPDLKEHIKVTASGCLSHCEDGITAVFYPQGEWLTKLTPDDGAILKEKLLRYADVPKT